MPELTVGELAALCGAELEGDADRVVTGPATLSAAGPRDISFLSHPRYVRQLERTAAGAVLVAREVARPREDLVLLRCEDPGSAFSSIVSAFAAPLPGPEPGVHPSAVVDSTVELGEGAAVGALAVVGPGSRIGARAVIHAGALVGAGVVIGEETEIHAGVVLYAKVSVGSRCIVHSGTVIGGDGYGFEPGTAGWVKVPQCGTVVVEDDVEIGSGCTIDRGRFGPTRLGRGTKLDNQVHLGHNVEIGERNLIVAQVAVAGSARTGEGVVIGGQTGVAGHVEIGSGARVAGQSGVYGDLEGGRDYQGSPAQPQKDELRRKAGSRKVPALLARVRELEKRLSDLEERLSR